MADSNCYKFRSTITNNLTMAEASVLMMLQLFKELNAVFPDTEKETNKAN
jgi:hypothetical protein